MANHPPPSPAPPPPRPHLDTTQLVALSSPSLSSIVTSLDQADQDDDDLDLNLDPDLGSTVNWDDPQSHSPVQQRERRRRMRRMFGGGRHRHSDSDRPGVLDDSDSIAAEDEEGEGEGARRPRPRGGPGEVAGMIFAATVSPFPLLLPLACTQLGPRLFVPLLALASALAWLGAVVIGLEGRYVGARSFPGLASGVFPHRFKLHKVGEFLAAAFVLGGSIVRTALSVVAVAEIVVDVVVPERRRRDWERGVAVALVCATWVLVPLIVPPLLSTFGLCSAPSRRAASSASYARLSSTSSPDLALRPGSPVYSLGPDARMGSQARPHWTALLRLPSWSVALLTWPVALLVLGVRMKQLNRQALLASSPNSSPSLGDLIARTSHLAADFPLLSPSDPSGASMWPAILVTFAAPLSAAHETFYYLTSLARPSSTASRRARDGAGGGFSLTASPSLLEDEARVGGGGVGGGAGDAAAIWGEGGSDPTRRGGGGEREGKRNQYPLALLVGHLGAFLVALGWALVGALSLPGSPLRSDSDPNLDPDLDPVPPAPNLLTDRRLPRGDTALWVVRLLVVAALAAQLDAHAAVGIGRVRRALRALATTTTTTTGGGAETARSAPPGVRARAVRRMVARTAVWAAAGALATVLVAVAGPKGSGEANGGEQHHPRVRGGHGYGMWKGAEWAGVVLGGWGGCLVPTLAYLVLFHLRRPRSILLPPDYPTSPHPSSSFSAASSQQPPPASSSSSLSGPDALLARKERQMQRRLSGRRIWTDAGVFGLLGPVGVLLVVRGSAVVLFSSAGAVDAG